MKKYDNDHARKKRLMITPLFVIYVTKNSVKIECVIIVICLVSFEALLTKSAT